MANANWNLPTTASLYADVIDVFNSKLQDAALGFDTTATNLPTNSIRWSSANLKWQKYNGSSWGDLATAYNITATAANAWSTARNLAVIGDASGTFASVNGSAPVTATLTLATVNSTTGTFGSQAAVPVITVNGKGLITTVTTAALGSMATQASTNISVTGGAISGLTNFAVPIGVADTTQARLRWVTASGTLSIGTGTVAKTLVDTNTAQTLTNKTWNGATIAVAYGGTGATTAAGARTNLDVDQSGTAVAMAIALG